MGARGVHHSDDLRSLAQTLQRVQEPAAVIPLSAGLIGQIGAGSIKLALAARNVASERRRAAALDGRHHLQLLEADVAAVGLTPSGAVVAENIRNLQSWTGHERRVLLRRLVLLALLGRLIERAHHLGD